MGAIILIAIFLALIGPSWLAAIVKTAGASMICFFLLGIGITWLIDIPNRLKARRRANG